MCDFPSIPTMTIGWRAPVGDIPKVCLRGRAVAHLLTCDRATEGDRAEWAVR